MHFIIELATLYWKVFKGRFYTEVMKYGVALRRVKCMSEITIYNQIGVIHSFMHLLAHFNI